MYTDPIHETISATDLREHVSDHLGRVQHANERVVIVKNGKPYAALVSFSDLRFFEALEDKLDLFLARTALAESKAKGEELISWDDVKARAGL
jgi:prevent-host-death family protein